MNSKTILLLHLLWPILLFGQSKQFSRLYDFTGGVELYGKVMSVDDGYILTGYIVNSNLLYPILARLDYNGDTLWKKEYRIFGEATVSGLTESLGDLNDSIVVASWTLDSNGSPSPSIIMFNAYGDSLWADTIDVWGNFFAVTETHDGNILAAGRVSTTTHLIQVFLCKYSPTGERLWSKNIGDFNQDDECYSISKYPGQGFVLGCQTEYLDDHNPYVIRINNNGSILWDKEFALSEWYESYAVAHVTDAGDIYLGSNKVMNKVVWNEYSKYWFARLNHEGDTVWTKLYGDSSLTLGTYDLVERRDGNVAYLLFGTPNGKFMNSLLELNSLGFVQSRINFTHDSSELGKYPSAKTIDTTSDNGLIVGGHFNYSNASGGSKQQFWVVKFDSNGCYDSTFNCTVGINEQAQKLYDLKIFPNPAQTQVTVHAANLLGVYNMLGQPQPCQQQQLGNSIEIDISGLPRGNYFIRSEEVGKISTGTFIKE